MTKWLIGLVAVIALVTGGVYTRLTSKPTITITGATAVYPLLHAAAQQDQAAAIKLTRTDSQTGLKQVATKKVTIGASDVFDPTAGRLVDHQIAVVGIAPVANPKAGVKALTTQQLRQIFAKQITNWRQVGGKDLAITVASRKTGSGTLANFQALALDHATPKADVTLKTTGAMQRYVQNHAGAIGFLPFNAVENDLVALTLDGIRPTVANVTTNRWQLWAYEHLYTNGSPTATTAKFIHMIQTQPELVSKHGYIPTKVMQVARTKDGMIEDTHN
ncbi:substrate-binding domain-containing protein [Lacticaseibacillus sp. GG6-2]